jgi:hypothetical protein
MGGDVDSLRDAVGDVDSLRDSVEDLASLADAVEELESDVASIRDSMGTENADEATTDDGTAVAVPLLAGGAGAGFVGAVVAAVGAQPLLGGGFALLGALLLGGALWLSR